MNNRPRFRSRSGCFTCRRRKKKCDESAYPNCKNCSSSMLQCSWPDLVVKKQERIRNSPSERAGILSSCVTLSESFSSKTGVVPHTSQTAGGEKVTKPERKGKNYFLERISMQQDCVEEGLEGCVDVFDVLYPVVSPPNTVLVPLVRDKIAHQLDISSDEPIENK